ncbi:MAG: NADH-quinone oxidoreductase subunit L [Pseudomonadota bacterium]|jgi:NADH-quinone oxidoreductase subunit L|nr:NADH-quinone oxidoreductase subunit L [Pseudomonadota bacterium]NLX32384.1 NADH-quinone oxidoreductase subunit L [Deltaproteobacteria bacterium]HNU85598.1 NADH-quinone oxidoreductase subunit L [Syntrophales bacterium]HNZ35221.1 NADH-quinone oxidoreductase subunit L [Syntrophales bacterium]HOF73573.1 NADH-quinone oxidoreductase subunit L [Syntrophales bacterium]
MPPESIWILPALPALGALANGLLGAAWRDRTVAAVAVGAVGLALAAALALMAEMLTGADDRIFSVTLWRWLTDGTLRIEAGLVLDRLAMVMVMVVLFVGFLIHLYSVDYMRGDAGYRRFFVCLNLFVFFMLVLVLGDNLVVTFVGWEGVGLCSYLLIGFWYEKTPASDAGRKAFIVNRIGDFGFLLGILLAAVTFGTVHYGELARLLAAGPTVPGDVVAAVALLLFMGAMGKSAQFPLHVWLPDAMEGPMPVSALIHAATMVNAGVYLMCRMAPLLERAPAVLPVIAAVGLLTALYAALSALGQRDIKRVLAYSTVSQIGYMFVALGCGLWAAGMFHLLTHGIFKGLLFLAAGAVIHALDGEQDLSRMGGLVKDLPAVSVTFIAGLLALAGIFPLSGFVSKDAILWGGFEHYGVFFWLAAFGGALATALYSAKLLSAFLGPRRADGRPHRPGPVIVAPLTVLAVFALLAGIPGLPLFTRDTFFARFLGMPAAAPATAASHSLEVALTVLQSMAVLAVLAGAIRIFARARRPADPAVLASGFGIDRLNDWLFVRPLKAVARFFAAVVDARVIDGAVNGLGGLSMALGRLTAGLQTGQLRHYAVSLIAGAFALIALTVFFAGGL